MDSDALAEALVSKEMDALILRKAGFVGALQAEAGPLVIVGLGLMVLTFVPTILHLGSGGLAILALALVPGVSLLGMTMWLNRVDPKPPWLLIRCALWGAGPAAFSPAW